MQKITLEINNSIYDYILFFLENIPKNLVSIKKEFQEKGNSEHKNFVDFNPRDFFNIGSNSKFEIDHYLQQNENEWDTYLDKK